MTLHIARLAILCLALAFPTAAQVLYDNGPINGTTDAWTINFGFAIGDSFALLNNSTVGGFNFGAWEYSGDRMLSVDWSITSQAFGGTLFGSGTASGANLSDQFISVNQYGYNIDKVTVTGLNVNLTGGTTYWLELQNAVVTTGDPVYWDENSGVGCTGDDGKGGGCPSEADCPGCIRGQGNLPSEAFDINGTAGGTVPEPASWTLFASGMVGVIGFLRRKQF